MNQIREIVTKAVIAKGKKNIKINHMLKTDKEVYSILGCMVINNQFSATPKLDEVKINGQFEVNVWYSLEGNSVTDVIKESISYEDLIKTKQIVNDYISGSDDCLVKIGAHPMCKDAKIKDNDIEVVIEFEVIVDIIGEAKMQVNILDDIEIYNEEEDDFLNQINENFINV